MLTSNRAIEVNIAIIRVFVATRRFLASNAAIFRKIETVEQKQLEYKAETDQKFNQIFNAIEKKQITPKQGIFFAGQIFDAYQFVSALIRNAKKSIILIDNYVDDTVLTLFSKRKQGIPLTIFTKKISKQ